MSASREKKQRQGSGPSEKTLQAQQQQADQKRKTVTYTIIGVVVAVLVAALLIWNSGFFQARATAATVGDTNLSAAELSYYYQSARMSTAQYAAYGINNFDTSLADDEQVYNAEDNTTYRDYFLETALANAQRNIALAKEALNSGHTEAEVKNDVNAQIDSVKSSAASSGYGYAAYLRAMYGPYMSAGVFEKIVRQTLLANLASSDKATELSDSYTEADLTAYYEKDDNADTLDTFEYSYLYFTPAEVAAQDEDGNDIDEETVNKQKEEALADAKKDAEEALDSLKGGSTMASLISKYELDSNSGDHLTTVGSGSINSLYKDELLALGKDESALVENGESGYYVITFHGRTRVEDPTKDVRHILARAETTTDADGNVVAPTDEAWAAAEEKINAIKAEYEAGEMTEDAFAALANEKSDDGDGTTGGLYTKNAPGEFVTEFSDWVFDSSRKVGDTGIVKHEGDASSYGNPYWGYHFIYLVGDNEPVWMRSARNTLTEEALTAWEEELRGNFATALTSGADNLGK